MVKTMREETKRNIKAPRWIKTKYDWGKVGVWILILVLSITVWNLAIKSLVEWMS